MLRLDLERCLYVVADSSRSLALSTLTSRSLFATADVRELKLFNGYREFRRVCGSSAPLLDHFVRAQQQRPREGDAELLRGLEG
jgi:hypothetical protein